jgi:hypothetical protein
MHGELAGALHPPYQAFRGLGYIENITEAPNTKYYKI